MKKLVLCILLLVVTLSGCQNNQAKEDIQKETTNIKTEQGVYKNKEWDSFEFPITAECVPDSETAIAVAEIILSNLQEQGYFPDYKTQSVFYDTEDNIWIVSFGDSSITETTAIAGSSFSIAIAKDDGRIIKMWVGE